MSAMSQQQRSREEYSALLARAFNGAITVDGQRIVAHPSGMLIARTPNTSIRSAIRSSVSILDRDNDWSDV